MQRLQVRKGKQMSVCFANIIHKYKQKEMVSMQKEFPAVFQLSLIVRRCQNR